eukprot:CAMPEP_0172151736 /NCGR_PEP_ID=MMETSP1050-20130122/405_1 /TAXON_ID=233186 /ORGANISM="Cryptomonas curvata, Strain CCAP979/52" /LENGTH=146 /DNA_ID=CAMNT_0012819895 /DNA_START=322 /DNA_END=762 /DNA_ORIENTATION=+
MSLLVTINSLFPPQELLSLIPSPNPSRICSSTGVTSPSVTASHDADWGDVAFVSPSHPLHVPGQLAPAELEYVPAAHATQSSSETAPLPVWYVPTPHVVQPASEARYWPGGQIGRSAVRGEQGSVVTLYLLQSPGSGFKTMHNLSR